MIGPSIEIKGSVTGDEDLVIEGTVEGTVELGSHQVTVGPSGKVNADIHAKVVNIDGEVSGDLNGGEKVIISKSGRVRGNIVAPRVLLEDGAIFKGSIDMDPGEGETAKVSLAPKKSAQAAPAGDDIAPGLDLKSG
jgi:cytoskeletal protein CcmA (bactofilin family)